MSHLMTKPTKWHVPPAKTQISLCIRLVCAVHLKKAGVLSYPSSAQQRLIRLGEWAFAGRSGHFVGFNGSNFISHKFWATVNQFLFTYSLFLYFLIIDLLMEIKICNAKHFLCNLFMCKYFATVLNSWAIKFVNINEDKVLANNSVLTLVKHAFIYLNKTALWLANFNLNK